MNGTPQLVSIGECLVEFSARSDRAWDARWAGDAVNVLFYASRLGLSSGLVSCIGEDLFAPMIRSGLRAESIDTSQMLDVPERNNGLYFIELDDEGEYSYHYWRRDSAATQTLIRHDEDALIDYLADARYVFFSGITLAILQDPHRLTALLDRLNGDTVVAFDTNYRPRLWSSLDTYRRSVFDVMPFVNLFLPSRPDLEAAFDRSEIDELVRRSDMTVMKLGARGCEFRCAEDHATVAAMPIAGVVDASGAGDSFNAGLLAALARGASLSDACRLASRVAAHVLGVRGAISTSFSEDVI